MPMQGTVEDLKRAFHKAKPQFYPSRQRFTFPLKTGEKKATALADGKKLSDFDVKDGTVLIFKDLGPQVRMLHNATSRRHHGCCILTLHSSTCALYQGQDICPHKILPRFTCD